MSWLPARACCPWGNTTLMALCCFTCEHFRIRESPADTDMLPTISEGTDLSGTGFRGQRDFSGKSVALVGSPWNILWSLTSGR